MANANAITPSGAYPTAEQVMNRARAYANDSYRQGKGRILTDQAAFTIEYLNGALEELQDKIGNNGVITLIKDNVILGPLTAIAEAQVGVQTFISYDGYFNGTVMVDLPKLPSDCRAPLRLWERKIGANLPFTPMTQPMEGLPSRYPNSWLGLWEYRQDRLNFNGSTIDEEVRLRYESRFLALADADDFASTEIQILSSTEALATLVVYRYARARGAPAAITMQGDCERMMRYIVRRYTRRAQTVPYYRQPYGLGGGSGSGNGNTNLPF